MSLLAGSSPKDSCRKCISLLSNHFAWDEQVHGEESILVCSHLVLLNKAALVIIPIVGDWKLIWEQAVGEIRVEAGHSS